MAEPTDEQLREAAEQIEEESRHREGVGFVTWAGYRLIRERALRIEAERLVARHEEMRRGAEDQCERMRQNWLEAERKLKEKER